MRSENEGDKGKEKMVMELSMKRISGY